MSTSPSPRVSSSSPHTAVDLPAPARTWAPFLRGVAFFAVICALVGVALGTVWRFVVTPPVWTMGADGRATMSERALAGTFGAEAWFSVLGALGGIIIGWLAWAWFKHRGWVVVPIGVLGAALAALVAWQVGELIAGSTFEQRLAAAKPGDQVPIDLNLDALSTLLIWPFFASVPIMVGATMIGESVGTATARGWQRIRGRHAGGRPEPVALPGAAPVSGEDAQPRG